MKKLILLRHAKAAKDIPNISDIQRPLTSRGYQDALRMGAWLATQPHPPGRIISSPAVRAYATALVVAGALDYPPAGIGIESRLYDSSVDDYLDTVAGIDNRISAVLISGHNMVLSDTADRISGGKMKDLLPTCGVVIFELDMPSWSAIYSIKKKPEIILFPSILQEK
jgi:phosphohistidine phosphatase